MMTAHEGQTDDSPETVRRTAAATHAHEARRIIETLNGGTMLITGEGHALLLEIASRQNIVTEKVLDKIAMRHEAVAARKATKMDGATAAQKRGTIAVIDVNGPIMRYADIFSEVSGGVSIESLATDFTAALNDPGVTAIVFHLDSPGGQVKGVNEFANMVRDARGKKPLGGYVESAGSAAYWIGSAVDPGWLWIDALGLAGSIGALVSMSKRRTTNSVEEVSDVSPKKTVDPESETGRAMMKQRANDIARVFVQSVADNRGLTTNEVISAEGTMLMGEEAVAAGLADKVGSFEELLAAMRLGAAKPAMPIKPAPMSATTKKEQDMSTATAAPVPTAEEKRSIWARLGAMLALTDDAPVAPPAPVAPVTAIQPPPVQRADAPIISNETTSLAAENDRLRAENVRLQAEYKARDEVRAKADAVARATNIETTADLFMTTYSSKFGKEAAVPFRALYVAAKQDGDDAAVANLEATAKAMPPLGPKDRLETKTGPTTAQVLDTTKPDFSHFAALDQLRTDGVQENHADFNVKYLAAKAKIEAAYGIA